MRFRHLRRILSSFRRLRWKLTLSYTLVTVAALVTVEIILFALIWVFAYFSSFLPLLTTRTLLEYAAPQMRPFLEAPQPDLIGLERWLEDIYTVGIETESGQRLTLTMLSSGRGSKMVVVDAEGRFVASIPAALGEYGETFLSDAPALLRTALDGEQDPELLYSRTPDNQQITSVPVLGQDGQVLGALYFVSEAIQLPAADYARSMLGTVGRSLIYFAVLAALLGTLFGFLTARGLTRRLSALTDAANAWGRGDFSAVVHDTSSDEIGQLARQLNRMAEQVQNLLHSREQLATLEERNRLARDLHDSVKQQVFATTMTLGTAEALWERDPAAARQKVAEALSLSQEAQRELTVLIRELHPAALEGKGLAAALQEHTEDWSRQTGIAAEVGVQGERLLPLEVEQALFRVAQEALANVARHSGAARTDVMLSFTDEFVTLTMADDGCGFDVAAAEGRGLGLRSMRERVKTLGGTLRVESAETGTTVEASVPFELPGAAEVPGAPLSGGTL